MEGLSQVFITSFVGSELQCFFLRSEQLQTTVLSAIQQLSKQRKPVQRSEVDCKQVNCRQVAPLKTTSARLSTLNQTLIVKLNRCSVQISFK